VSTLLNAVAFVCLLRETPQSQAKFRKYLIYIQVRTGICLYGKIAPCGGYCVGWVCRLGVPMRFCLALTMWILTNTGLSIITCFVFRHQSIVSEGSRLKFNP
ncbi:hypothetical protein PFISCL1PPCAC_13875, partial [Pristionchus fissidentatus]